MKKDPESGFSETTPILHTKTQNRETVIPCRYSLALSGFLGFFNVYAMRVNLNVAMVAMVGKQLEELSSENIACHELLSSSDNSSLSAYFMPGEFDWDSTTQSQILGAFFIGYLITQIPGGFLAERYGAKWLFGFGVLVTAILTILTPFAARHSYQALIGVRIVEGLAEGVTFPAMNVLIGRWVPKLERSRISTFIFSGCPIGSVVSLSVSGYVSSSERYGGWPMVFYLFGAIACGWFVIWVLSVFDSPEKHPRISKAELQYIQAGLDQRSNDPTPWRSFLKSPKVWALTITHLGYNWGFYTLLTELPTYLANVLHFDLKQNGLLSATPYLCQTIFAALASAIADKMRASGRFSITFIRKVMNSVAFYLPGIFVLCIIFTGCNSFVIIAFIVISVAFSGFMYSGFNITHVDMSPEYAGTLMGITNCVANLSGFLAPAFAGWIVKDGHTVENWSIIFIVTAVVYFITGTVYNLFASAEVQPWGESTPPSPPSAPLPSSLPPPPDEASPNKTESSSEIGQNPPQIVLQ